MAKKTQSEIDGDAEEIRQWKKTDRRHSKLSVFDSCLKQSVTPVQVTNMACFPLTKEVAIFNQNIQPTFH